MGGITKNDQEAVKWFQKAADQGDASAQNNLGWMYQRGRGIAQSNQEAVKWFQKAADQEDACAQYNLGLMYEQGRGVAQSNQEAVKWYRKAADQGNAGVQYNLGWICQQGQGVAQSNQEAVKWFQKAAEKGFGCDVQTGQKSPVDVTTIAWHEKIATEEGNSNAMQLVGLCYEGGLRGVERNKTEAMRWYTQAASKGDVMAMLRLGRLYAAENKPDSDDTAVIYYRKAIDTEKHQEALRLLQDMFLDGRGQNGDPVFALYVLEDLAKNGSYVKRQRAQAMLSHVHEIIKKAMVENSRAMISTLEEGYLQGKGLTYNFMDALTYLEKTAHEEGGGEKQKQAKLQLERLEHNRVKNTLSQPPTLTNESVWNYDDL